MDVPSRQVRACFTAETITVYQAYSADIAVPALTAGRFVAPFSRHRMTWIKPSFLWMMYRCGWATKPGQDRVLAIEICRDGFEWALQRACPSQFTPGLDPDRRAWARRVKTSPVRVQWDPERSLRLGPLPYRSLQVGLSGEAVDRYVEAWIVAITDITATAHAIHHHLLAGDEQGARGLVPTERPYLLPVPVAAAIGATPATTVEPDTAS